MKKKIFLIGSIIAVFVVIAIIAISQMHFKHLFGEWYIDTLATCTETGLEKRECECGKTEERVIDTLGHYYEHKHSDDDNILLYKCNNCSDEIIRNKVNICNDNSEDVLEIKDINFENFFIDLKTAQDEQYIKDNLKIIDMDLYESEYESVGLITNYKLTNLGADHWRLEFENTNDFTSGTVYYVEAFNDLDIVTGDNSTSKRLNFTTQEHEHVDYKYNDNIAFFPKSILDSSVDFKELLEPRYDIVDNENEYVSVKLNSLDGIELDRIVSIGTATSSEEISSECFLGKVYSYDPSTNNVVFVSPSLEEIFDELDIYLEDYVDLEGEINNENTKKLLSNEFENSLLNNEEFVLFINASYLTASEYAESIGLVAMDSKEIEDNINDHLKLEFDVKFEDIKLWATADGELSIPFENEKGKKIMDFNVKMHMEFSTELKFNINYELKKVLNIPYGINSFDFSITNINFFKFNFDVTFDYAIDGEFDIMKPQYVANKRTKFVHNIECSREGLMNEENRIYIYDEETLNMYVNEFEYSVCKVCKCHANHDYSKVYYNDLLRDIHYGNCRKITKEHKQHVDNNIESFVGYAACDMCHCGDENVLQKSITHKFMISDDWEAEMKLTLNSGALPVDKKKYDLKEFKFHLYCFEMTIGLDFIFEFSLKASLAYEYETTFTNSYGIRLEGGKFVEYNPNPNIPKKDVKQTLSVAGEIHVKAGIGVDIDFSIIGLSRFASIGITAELGLYVDMIGVAEYTTEHNPFAAAYLDVGVFGSGTFDAKFFLFNAEITLYEKKFPIYKAGYDKVYYSIDVDDVCEKVSNLYTGMNVDNIINTIKVSGINLLESSATSFNTISDELRVMDLKNLKIRYTFDEESGVTIGEDNTICLPETAGGFIDAKLTIDFIDTSDFWVYNSGRLKFSLLSIEDVSVKIERKELHDVEIVSQSDAIIYSHEIGYGTSVYISDISKKYIDGIYHEQTGWYDMINEKELTLEEGYSMLSYVKSDIKLKTIYTPIERDGIDTFTDNVNIAMEITNPVYNYTFNIANTTNENKLFYIHTSSDLDTDISVSNEGIHCIIDDLNHDADDVNGETVDFNAELFIFVFKGEQATITVSSADAGYYMIYLSVISDSRDVKQVVQITDGYYTNYINRDVAYGQDLSFKFGHKIIDGKKYFQNGWYDLVNEKELTISEGLDLLSNVTNNLKLKATFITVDNWGELDLILTDTILGTITSSSAESYPTEYIISNTLTNSNYSVQLDVDISVSGVVEQKKMILEYVNTSVVSLTIDGICYGEIELDEIKSYEKLFDNPNMNFDELEDDYFYDKMKITFIPNDNYSMLDANTTISFKLNSIYHSQPSNQVDIYKNDVAIEVIFTDTNEYYEFEIEGININQNVKVYTTGKIDTYVINVSKDKYYRVINNLDDIANADKNCIIDAFVYKNESVKFRLYSREVGKTSINIQFSEVGSLVYIENDYEGITFNNTIEGENKVETPKQFIYYNDYFYKLSGYTNLKTNEALSIEEVNDLLSNVTTDLFLQANYELFSMEIRETTNIENMCFTAGNKYEFTIIGASYGQDLYIRTTGEVDTSIEVICKYDECYYHGNDFFQDVEDNGEIVNPNASFSGLLLPNKTIKIIIEALSSGYADIRFDITKSNKHLVYITDDFEFQTCCEPYQNGSNVNKEIKEFKKNNDILYKLSGYTNLKTNEILSIEEANELLSNVTTDLFLQANYELFSMEIRETTNIENMYFTAGNKYEFTIIGASYGQDLYIHTTGEVDTSIEVICKYDECYYHGDDFFQDVEDNGEIVNPNASFSGLLLPNKTIKIIIETLSDGDVDIRFDITKSNKHLVYITNDFNHQPCYEPYSDGSRVNKEISDRMHIGNQLYKLSGYTNLKTNQKLSIEEANELLNNVTTDLFLQANYESLANIYNTVSFESLYLSAGSKIEFTIHGASYGQDLYIRTTGEVDTSIEVIGKYDECYYHGNDFFQDVEDNGEIVNPNASFSGLLLPNKTIKIIIEALSSGYVDIRFDITKSNKHLVYITNDFNHQPCYEPYSDGSRVNKEISDRMHIGNQLYKLSGYTNLKTNQKLSIEEANELLNNVTTDLFLQANYESLANIYKTIRIESLYLSVGSKIEFTIHGTSYNQNLYLYTVGNIDTGIKVMYLGTNSYYSEDNLKQDGDDENGETVDFNASLNAILCANETIKICIEILSSGNFDIQFNLYKY